MSSTDKSSVPSVTTKSSFPATTGSPNHISIFERASIKLQEFRDRFYKALNINSSSSLPLPQISQRIIEILQTVDKYLEISALNDNNRGFYREGLYRVPGSVVDTNILYSQLFEGSTETSFLSRMQVYPEEVVCSVVKKRLRQLNGILPLHLYKSIEQWEELVHPSPQQSSNTAQTEIVPPVYPLENVRNLLSGLLDDKKYIFGTLLQHLHHVHYYRNQNQMHAAAISVVFAPIIFSTDNLDLSASMNIITIASHFLQYLLSIPLQELGLQNYILLRSNVLTMENETLNPKLSLLRKKNTGLVVPLSANTDIDTGDTRLRPLPQIPSSENENIIRNHTAESSIIRILSPTVREPVTITSINTGNVLSTRELPPLVSPPYGLNVPPSSPVTVTTISAQQGSNTVIMQSSDIHERMTSLREQLDNIENRLIDLSSHQQSIEALINPVSHEILSTVHGTPTTVDTEGIHETEKNRNPNVSLTLDNHPSNTDKRKVESVTVSKASRSQSVGESSSMVPTEAEETASLNG